eukprot:SM000040S14776  [mRNA]  locus=s40:252418:258515:- [translate_table: standard]
MALPGAQRGSRREGDGELGQGGPVPRQTGWAPLSPRLRAPASPQDGAPFPVVASGPAALSARAPLLEEPPDLALIFASPSCSSNEAVSSLPLRGRQAGVSVAVPQADSGKLAVVAFGMEVLNATIACIQRQKLQASASDNVLPEPADNILIEPEEAEAIERLQQALEQKYQSDLAQRIASGEFTVASRRTDTLGGLRRWLAGSGLPGRAAAKVLASLERRLRAVIPRRMPEARGDIRQVIGQPFFVPLYNLFLVYGGVFRLSFGPKQFAIVSDAAVTKYILKDNAKAYSKGLLSEILDFVMGKGLIPADGEVWRTRRRAIVPSFHKKYVAAMLKLFGRCTERLCQKLEVAATEGRSMEMESLFSRMTLDVIGKAVFNYDFDSLSKDTGVVEAVYTALREAEARSVSLFPYWKIAPLRMILPRQRKVTEALKLINKSLDTLIDTCKVMVENDAEEFSEEYVNEEDPSILRFLLASGDEVSSKQLRDDLMTMLIAGHETTAAVLTWAFYLLCQHPNTMEKLQAEVKKASVTLLDLSVDAIIGDRWPGMEDLRNLKYTTRVINEAMRLYPQPPVLIRRALEDDVLGGYKIKQGQDIFISVWNLHRSPEYWEKPEEFNPERWPVDGPSPNEVTEGFTYLPFGGGPRKCVGDVFALYESVIAVAMLVRRFDFKLAPGAPPVGMTTGATIHTTDGLHLAITRRNPPISEYGKGAFSENGSASRGHAESTGSTKGSTNGSTRHAETVPADEAVYSLLSTNGVAANHAAETQPSR